MPQVDYSHIPRNESVNLRGGESGETPKLECCTCSEPELAHSVEQEGYFFEVPWYCKRCGKIV